MDIGIIIGIVIGFGSLIFAFIEEGGSPLMLVAFSAAVIVFGGTIGAVAISFPTSKLKNIGKIIKVAFINRKVNTKEQIEFFKELSTKTRKNGLLSIEGDLSNSEMDPFIKKGLQMVVDGVEPSTIKGILETKLEQMSERHHDGAGIFDAAGGFSPTMGIIGTVMGLVQVLSNLDDPSTLGPKIAVAFIATLYGVGTANLLWLPIANKLKALDKEEILEKEMSIEAIMLIQEGANPNTLVAKLEGFLTDKEVAELNSNNAND
ncbi:chemotaxis protein MotA [Clostridium zeae]|uniref:Chemotaxis protein MotA n=1 Tax=Clostridium zeae TaxID=2759022 RepID=A0ABQ1ECK5_9CLOT|nr:flagellar motor protein [Clostridium zeae]GFZ32469.1 chemotaxis protein MotA [Clostridium zeae]